MRGQVRHLLQGAPSRSLSLDVHTASQRHKTNPLKRNRYENGSQQYEFPEAKGRKKWTISSTLFFSSWRVVNPHAFPEIAMKWIIPSSFLPGSYGEALGIYKESPRIYRNL